MDHKINFLKAVLSSHIHKAASRLVSLVEKFADDTEPEEDDNNKKKKTLMSKIMPIIESVVDHHTA